MKNRLFFIQSHAGLSLVELLVSMTVMLIVFAMVASAFLQTRKISVRNQLDVEIVQNARIGLDEIATTLRMIGYRRDVENGQPALIEAAPFQVIFHADLDEDEIPSEQNGTLPKDSVISLYEGPPEYEVPMTYTTGAETIRLTLDSSRDGLVDRRDINDSVGERSTQFNPDDMEIIQRINFNRVRPLTSGVLGPYDRTGHPTGILPMFQYWTVNPDQSFSLIGDDDGNGQLEGDERYFRAIVSQSILQQIRRIDITLTVQSSRKDPFMPHPYRQIQVGTTVNLRNTGL
ncbi:hypothetical protein CSA56_08210 [candidate division KSB3 bacterium]|uniref:Prepilin-type cleavage/methylation domain-containing protein n=1 Tax=candidate division KSB3 bacterium TaxID=2044937 RepID=A0A2G6KFA9_9BACT|nr:MAG: hypothetical protein CSA56_08210 [candidate division KSB3 bacterium]